MTDEAAEFRRSLRSCRRRLYTMIRHQTPLLPNTRCSSRVFLEAPFLREDTLAVLRLLDTSGLAGVDWTWGGAVQSLSPVARETYEDIASFVVTITRPQISAVLAAAYDLDPVLAAVIHHSWWDADLEICPELEAAVMDGARVSQESSYARFWVDGSQGYRMGCGARTWLCLWLAQPPRVSHVHVREYSI